MSQSHLQRLPLGPLARFGILGGSFNPPHVGHLSIAQQILAALRLERVFLMPAATPPHKLQTDDLAPGRDRLEMCRLAAEGLRGLEASALELGRGGVSYTVETARRLREAYGPRTEIRFLIGSDSLAELPSWRECGELFRLLDFAVAERREAPITEELWKRLRAELGGETEAKLRAQVVAVERVDVSAREIRERLRQGGRITGWVRREVEEYIYRRGLYGARRT